MSNIESSTIKLLPLSNIIEGLFRKILNDRKSIKSKNSKHIDNREIIKDIFKLFSEKSFLGLDAAIWVPMKGHIDDTKFISLVKMSINKPILYNLEYGFINRMRNLLLSSRFKYGKDIVGYFLGFLTKDKISNNIIDSILNDRNAMCVHPDFTEKLIEIYSDFKINKGVMGVHQCFDGFNIACLYRYADSRHDFDGNELIFIRCVMPFLHVISSIRIIPWIALIDERFNDRIIFSDICEGFNSSLIMETFLCEFMRRRKDSDSDIYSFYAGDNYKFIAVRIYDFRQNSECSPLLAVAAFVADDFIAGNYRAMYGI